ncbi:hypothetical protein [Diaphorobacter sp.]|uniref:hypothetical protein n=1 Tax=Diaphorobacter sp. TaxID=1934310 RepID=UPI00258A27EF|nr:hypothetical protein [Diaphorobacter sp.]
MQPSTVAVFCIAALALLLFLSGLYVSATRARFRILCAGADDPAHALTEAVRAQSGGPASQEPTAQVPRLISQRQAHLALLDNGLLDDVEALIKSLPDAQKRKDQIEWRAPIYERDSQFLQEMWALLGGDATSLDALFLRAAAL